MNPPIPATIKGVGVRFFANPELGRGASETEAMCQKTIASLEWLNEHRPLIVLIADRQNNDPNCVQMRALGRAIANVDRDDAPLVRAMLGASPSGKLITQITDVNIYRHGFIYVKMPVVPCSVVPVEIGADWSQWTHTMPFSLPSEFFLAEEELSLVLREVLLPDLGHSGLEQLTDYLALWTQNIRFNHSREVITSLREFIAILSASEREEVRRLALDLDHLRTKRGTPEVIGEMVEHWWEPLLASPEVGDSFAQLRQCALGESHQLLGLLDYVEAQMRPMPERLYHDVGDVRRFFSHLYYLAPPRQALQGVLSLMAVRTLVCRELGLSQAPFFGCRVGEGAPVPAVGSPEAAALGAALPEAPAPQMPVPPAPELPEELFHFVHPELEGNVEISVHKQVKKLVSRYGIRDICDYLAILSAERKVFLSANIKTVYEELVRMGMPNGEGFSYKFFEKCYKR